MGIASLILGIIGFLIGVTIFKDLALILCVLAVVLGIIAIVKKKNRVIAIIAVVIAIIGFVVVFKEDDSKKATEKKATEVVEVTNDNGEVVATKKAKEENSDAEYEVGNGSVKVWTNSIGTKWISASVPVKNTGKTNLYLSTGTFDIENSDGTLEDTINMVSVYPQVLKPGETAYYFEETTYDGSSTSGLKVVPHVEVEKAKVDCTRYEVSEVQIKDEQYFGAKVLGRVENKTDTDETSVYVVAQLFDSNKNLIGVEFTILDNGLKAGEKKAFQTSSLDTEISASQIASYVVYAFPHQYQF